ncbi:uncharacterized protein LOC121382377 [Gigantopelta aegis]|uniref:uncharacterized protein LOC121382377 n=1 Tax=Gigantopelta aegis TaxID=1735272 RepID=UPI001B88B261|nr:uncharacterized protein LOC121382377 [Gigantopelta aegis]
MTSADVTDRLPKCWQGLFGALRCQRNGLQLAKLWLQHKCSSQADEAPQWQALLSCLTETEPRHHGSSLTFVPLFCLLSRDLQTKLLSVMYQHRWEICVSSLQTFVGVIHAFTGDGTWQRTLCDMLSRSSAVSSNCGAESSNHAPQMELTPAHYSFTQSNTALTDQVCHQVLSGCSVSPWQTSTNMGATGVTTYIKEKTNIIPSPDENPSRKPFHREETRQVCDAGVAEETLETQDVIVVDDEDSLMESPPTKRAKQGIDIKDETTAEKSEVHIDEMLQAKAEWLREVWQSSCLPVLEASELSFLSSLPACQMKLLCDAVNMSSLPDECLLMAFELLKRITLAVSYSSCVAFISGCFIHKFRDLDHTASRTLTGVLINLGETFPKQIVDSITAGSQINEMTSSQSGILCRLCKESFSVECQAYLLRKLCESGVMNEHSVLVVACILENLDNLDETTTSVVFDCIHKSAQSLCQSLKFGKLIFTFVTKYGNTWSAAQLSLLFQVADLHKTFMKKSVLAALRRISK